MITQSSKSLFESFCALSRDLGWLNASIYSIERLLRKGLNGRLRIYKYYFVAQPVRETSLLPPGRGRTIDIRMIDEDDEITHHFPRPTAAMRARYKQGAKCLVASKQGRFIGYLWLHLGSYLEDEVRAIFSPQPSGHAAWDFDVYVEPDYRVGFAFSRLWDEANRFLTENEVRWSCSRISAFNPGSLAAHARLGTKTLGSAVFLCAGRWQLTVATVAPYIHLSAHSGSIPAFRLNTESIQQNNPTST